MKLGLLLSFCTIWRWRGIELPVLLLCDGCSANRWRSICSFGTGRRTKEKATPAAACRWDSSSVLVVQRFVEESEEKGSAPIWLPDTPLCRQSCEGLLAGRSCRPGRTHTVRWLHSSAAFIQADSPLPTPVPSVSDPERFYIVIGRYRRTKCHETPALRTVHTDPLTSVKNWAERRQLKRRAEVAGEDQEVGEVD